MGVTFVTGTGTGVGKTYVTGLLAGYLLKKKVRVITMKLVQTGCPGMSEDIIKHREIMGMSPGPYDKLGVTCPYSFAFPSSPELAASLENSTIEFSRIDGCIEELSIEFDEIIIEGTGGALVPLNRTQTVADYISSGDFRTIITATPVLGSINHILLTVEALQKRRINIAGIVYNLFFNEKKEIVSNTREVIKRYFPLLPVIDVGGFDKNSKEIYDFSPFGI